MSRRQLCSDTLNNAPKSKEDLDSISTEAESFAQLHRRDLLGQAVHQVGKAVDLGLEHHLIAGKVSSGTFTADKICKLSSASLKVIRAYGLSSNLKGCERLGGQIGQVRRLLRVDRLIMIMREIGAFSKNKKTTLSDKILIVFKLMLLVEDSIDLTAYLMQMKIIAGQRMPELKKKVQGLYMVECIGWFLFYLREWLRAKDDEEKSRHLMAMGKYTLDGLVAHNELGNKLFNLDATTTSVLSLLSGGLNIYLVWK